jgi:hypothetical protein
LDDPGYRAESDGRAIQYGGWRKIWAFVPAGVLKGGENQVDVQLANGSSQVTLRNLRLQVVFGEGKSAVPVPAQAPAPSTKNFTAKSFSLPRLRTGLSSGAPVVGLRQE